MGTAQSNELMMLCCPGDALSLQQHPRSRQLHQKQAQRENSPTDGLGELLWREKDLPGRIISVRTLWPHRGHPAQSPYDNDAPLPGKTESDAAD